MALLYKLKDRNVIPNWRDFKRTILLGELSSSANLIKAELNFDNSRAIRDWTDNPSIGNVADLLNSIFVSGSYDIPEAKGAIDFLHEHQNESSQSLVQLASIIANNSKRIPTTTATSLLEVNIENCDLEDKINYELIFKIINKTRNISRQEYRNPIIWIELARLYSITGQLEKANKAIITSLALAPQNRFVLRSATRFFAHTNQKEKALYYLKKSNIINSDPWLISAHIATSASMGRFSTFIKPGQAILNSNSFSEFDTTELASSIGTLEFKDGSIKKAKILFSKSLRSPNDNSLAQVEWISRDDSRFKINLSDYSKVRNPFEAYALQYFVEGKWYEAMANSKKWLIDTPFSKRPAILASYIALGILENFDEAIQICKLGLMANPGEPLLINNIIYSLALSNQKSELLKYLLILTKINFKEISDQTKITLQATLGLAELRLGNIKQGKRLYEYCINSTDSIEADGEYYRSLAIINYARELLILNDQLKDEYISIIRKMEPDKKYQDLITIRNNFLAKYNLQ